MINCNYSHISISITVSEILTSLIIKNDYIIFSAGGPDRLNDLKLILRVKSRSIYYMRKYQIPETKFFSDRANK